MWLNHLGFINMCMYLGELVYGKWAVEILGAGNLFSPKMSANIGPFQLMGFNLLENNPIC